jgi:hypothetical protein
MVGIWLALGLIALASCAPPSTQLAAQNAGIAPVGSAPPNPQPETHFASNVPIDNGQSTALTNYLHSRQLPLVGARVLASNGGPRQAILYGYVATPFGKADAVDKAREFLNDSGAQVDNRINIEPDLAGPAANPNTSTADNNPDLNNPDIQSYKNQQNQQLTQQQQQYMNQGSPFGAMGGSPLSMFLPLLGFGGGMGFGGGGTSFGMGGGGTGFGFGGGGMGSPFGSPAPYNSYPSSPPPTYGSPYGP